MATAPVPVGASRRARRILVVVGVSNLQMSIVPVLSSLTSSSWSELPNVIDRVVIRSWDAPYDRKRHHSSRRPERDTTDDRFGGLGVSNAIPRRLHFTSAT